MYRRAENQCHSGSIYHFQRPDLICELINELMPRNFGKEDIIILNSDQYFNFFIQVKNVSLRKVQVLRTKFLKKRMLAHNLHSSRSCVFVANLKKNF